VRRAEAPERGGSIATYQIDSLRAPLLVSWQLTRDCDLCCAHCCTESAPGKALPDELDAAAALRLAAELVRGETPYVMLCGGEPLIVPHFFQIAETLGNAGVQLKIESNGQRLDDYAAQRLAALPVRSVQVSLDGDTQEVYARQRAGGRLAGAHAACRAVRTAGMPLEVTFAPTRLNIHEAGAVLDRARALGAFRFNTGALMRIGTAARRWAHLVPDAEQYRAFIALLRERSALRDGEMELYYEPFSMEEALRASLEQPPATLLVLPNGRVKVAAALPYTCADLRTETLAQVWEAYRRAWHSDTIIRAAQRAIAEGAIHAEANRWRALPRTDRTDSLEA
jgi:MoaA/NifB/PqqE/SkfB family radical SAM enzyme